MKIFLNAGHGGIDPGTMSKSGTKEKDICLSIVRILQGMLLLKGFDVQFFQETMHFTEVSAAENKSNSDLFISIHCNGHDNPNAHGIETLYYKSSSNGKKLAQRVQKSLISEIKLSDRGIKPRVKTHVLKRTLAPAILVECAFLSNPKEEIMLKNTPEIFAKAIFEGILKHLKV